MCNIIELVYHKSIETYEETVCTWICFCNIYMLVRFAQI